MITYPNHSPHFHIHWTDNKTLDWECFNSHEEARTRAVELSRPGETFKIEKVSAKCPLHNPGVSA